MKLKYIEEAIIKVLMAVSLITVFGFVAAIVWTIFRRGAGCITWEMVSSLPGGGFYIGKEGGFLNAIVGSVYIVTASTLLGLIVSIPVVFYLNVFLRSNSRFAYVARLAYDVLFGIPSIVYGAFAFTLMIYMGMRTSLLGGILVTTLLIIPILIRSMDEVTRNFPHDLLDASYSLGATRLETMGIVLRQIAPGIATATLLSVGRAIGDAAGVMFTAGFSDSIPTTLTQPAATLPLSIFFQLSAPQTEVQNRAYAAALVLTIIVLVISLAGRFIMQHFSKNRI
ncbi:MAG: ABC transporter permease subunit [Alistipes sp.]|nr:ABC transporter permease subunit [Alistipes sp.]